MRYLHIRPRAGITNRMRALASAMWAADELGLHLVMTWELDHLLNSPFEDLFTNRIDRDAGKLHDLPVKVFKEATAIHLPGAGEDPEGTVYEVDSCQPFSFRPWIRPYSQLFWTGLRPYLLRLKPVDEVLRMVDRVASRFVRETLGVHVRSGRGGMEFVQSRHIRNELFFEEIDTVLARRPKTRIFLACDSPEVVEEFMAQYGERITTLYETGGDALPGSVDTPGMRMALADLLLLSRTDRILGSYFSSFSEMAGVLGAIPIKRIGADVRGPGWEKDFVHFVESAPVRLCIKRFLARLKPRRRVSIS